MSLSVSNTNPAFCGTMLIPASELMKKGPASHETMRQIGLETAKFAKPEDTQVTQDGILVKIDDNKEKEYQAIIAKYGVSIKKVDTPIEKNNNADLSAYKFMISKLDPKGADAKVENYAKLPEPEKSKEYLKVYNEFKQSKFSHENMENAKVK